MKHNAAGVVLCHNHPSGSTTLSQADLQLTNILRQAPALVDVRVLDRMIVATGEVLSMAERGLMWIIHHFQQSRGHPAFCIG